MSAKWPGESHLAGKDVLGRGIGGVQEEQVYALIHKKRVAAHSGMPSHITRVKDHLRQGRSHISLADDSIDMLSAIGHRKGPYCKTFRVQRVTRHAQTKT